MIRSTFEYNNVYKVIDIPRPVGIIVHYPFKKFAEFCRSNKKILVPRATMQSTIKNI